MQNSLDRNAAEYRQRDINNEASIHAYIRFIRGAYIGTANDVEGE